MESALLPVGMTLVRRLGILLLSAAHSYSGQTLDRHPESLWSLGFGDTGNDATAVHGDIRRFG